jgi:hypothetical protein
MHPVGQRIGDQLRDQLGANDGVVTPALAVDGEQVDGRVPLVSRRAEDKAAFKRIAVDFERLGRGEYC